MAHQPAGDPPHCLGVRSAWAWGIEWLRGPSRTRAPQETAYLQGLCWCILLQKFR
jgi:hypothetical protein